MTPGKKTGDSNTPRKKGETIKEKVHRHLNDKNDVITEEDIRDAVAGSAYDEESKEKIQEDLNDQTVNKENNTSWKVNEE